MFWSPWAFSPIAPYMQAEIERLFDERPEAYTEDHFRLFQNFRAALNAGGGIE